VRQGCIKHGLAGAAAALALADAEPAQVCARFGRVRGIAGDGPLNSPSFKASHKPSRGAS
jgi:hypothetical protein